MARLMKLGIDNFMKIYAINFTKPSVEGFCQAGSGYSVTKVVN